MFTRHVLRCAAAAFALLVAISAAAAPELPSDWPTQGREPARTRTQLVLVSDLVGQYWTLGGVCVYVHDLALARLPEGMTVATRADLELPDGTRLRNEISLDDLSPGAYEVYSLDEAFPGSVPRLWWADATGELRMTDAETAGPAAVGGAGQVVIDPTMVCTIGFTALCVASNCAGPCGMFPAPCACNSPAVDKEKPAACGLGVWATRCEGTCPAGRQCLGGGSTGCACAE